MTDSVHMGGISGKIRYSVELKNQFHIAALTLMGTDNYTGITITGEVSWLKQLLIRLKEDLEILEGVSTGETHES